MTGQGRREIDGNSVSVIRTASFQRYRRTTNDNASAVTFTPFEYVVSLGMGFRQCFGVFGKITLEGALAVLAGAARVHVNPFATVRNSVLRITDEFWTMPQPRHLMMTF